MKIAVYGKEMWWWIGGSVAAKGIAHVETLSHPSLAVMAIALALSIRTLGQSIDAPELKLGTIIGTVTDVNGNAVPGARVVLQGPDMHDSRTVTTSENGFFQFDRTKPGIPYSGQHYCKGFGRVDIACCHSRASQAKILNAQLRIPRRSRRR